MRPPLLKSISLGIIFIPTGVSLIATSNSIYEKSITYDEDGAACSITKQNQGKLCTVR